MNGTSAPADALRSISRAEAVALADGLRKHASKGVAVAEDPMLILITRLLASLPDDANDELTDRDARLDIANRACDELRTQRDDALGELNMRIASGVTNSDEAQKAERERQQAITDLEKVVATNVGLGERNRALGAELDTVRDGRANAIKKATRETAEVLAEKHNALIDLQKERDKLEARCAEAVSKKDQANTYLAELRGRVQEAKAAITHHEWSGKHRIHRDRTGAAKCCKVCGGLSTDYDHAEAGHTKGCIFKALNAAIRPTK